MSHLKQHYMESLVADRDWAALVRFSFTWQYGPAFLAAIPIARAWHPQHGPVVADWLEAFRTTPLDFGIQPPLGLDASCSESELATVAIVELFPRIALCELAANAPVVQQRQLLEIGSDAALRAMGAAELANDRALCAFFTFSLGVGLRGLRALDAYFETCRSSVLRWRECIAEYQTLAEEQLAMALVNLGTAQSELHQLEGARDSFIEALAIYRRLTETVPEVLMKNIVTCLTNLGGVQLALRRFSQAQDSLTEALAISRRLALMRPEIYEQDVVRTLEALGNVQRESCQREMASDSLNEALNICRRLAETKPDTFGRHLANTLNNLGNLQSDLRQLEQASKSHNEALAIRRRLAQTRPEVYDESVAWSLNNLGNVLRDLNQFEQALDSLNESLAIRRRLALTRSDVFAEQVAMTLNNLGNVQLDLRQFEAAKASLSEALEMRRCLAETFPEAHYTHVAMTLNNLGNVQRELRQLDAARASYTEALGIYLRCGSVATLIEQRNLHGNLGQLFREESGALNWPDYVRACEQLEQACALVEQERAIIHNPQLRQQALAHTGHLFTQLARSYVDRWDATDEAERQTVWLQRAVEVAEAGRCRGVLDLLARELDPRSAPAELVEQFRVWHSRLHHLAIELEAANQAPNRNSMPPGSASDSESLRHFDLRRPRPSGTSSQMNDTADENTDAASTSVSHEEWVRMKHRDFEEAKQQMAEHLRAIRVYDPLFDPTQPVRPVSWGELQTLLVPHADTVLVQLLTNADMALALLVDSSGVRSVRLPTFTDEIAIMLGNVWLGVQQLPSVELWQQMLDHLLGELSKHVLAPLLPHLAQAKRLILCPHHTLHLYPFHACPLPGEPSKVLADRFEVIYTPSMSLVQHVLRRRINETKESLVLSVPDSDPRHPLIFTKVETELLDLDTNTRCLRDAEVTAESIRSNGKHARFLHYTGHATCDLAEPLKSPLHLHDGSKFTLREVFGLELNAQMVALNGCRTGQQMPDPNGEVVSFVTGFLFAGARCAITTLWSVADVSAALLMAKFHELWQNGHGQFSPSQALREAQRWLRQDITSGPMLLDEVLPCYFKRLPQHCTALTVEVMQRAEQLRPLTTPPFAHPFHWAAHTVNGVAW